MKERNIEESTYWMLLQVAVRAKHNIVRLAETYDLSVMQFIVLCSMKPGKGMPMNTISAMLFCDASNVTGIVERLVSQGLITREECAKDRRIKLIQLTKKGEAVREAALRDMLSRQPDTIGMLSDAEQEQFNTLLKKALTPKKS